MAWKKTKMSYRDATIRQSLLWVNGKSIHSQVTGECCPDLSCCNPELFIEDRDRRMEMHLDLLRRLDRGRRDPKQHEEVDDAQVE